MPWMVAQPFTSAVRDAYRTADLSELEARLAEARMAVAWVDGLRIERSLRAALAEQIAAVADGFERLVREAGNLPDPGSRARSG